MKIYRTKNWVTDNDIFIFEDNLLALQSWETKFSVAYSKNV